VGENITVDLVAGEITTDRKRRKYDGERLDDDRWRKMAGIINKQDEL
jgi:hypothetical protein